MKKYQRKKNRFQYEELEPRLLLSGGVESLAVDAAWEPELGSDAQTSEVQVTALLGNEQTEETTRELVFIDAAVENYQALVEDLDNSSDTSREFEIIILDSSENGLNQISTILEDRQDIDAVHFITHGSDGLIQLGNTQLDNNNIEDYEQQLIAWQNALDENADILFYGCDLADSASGLNLIQTISNLTGADVAASDDITGDAGQGGDWDLEHETGIVETGIAVSDELQQGWHTILPVISFQEGVNSYTNTSDTLLDEDFPGTDNSLTPNVGVHTGPGANGDSQALIRFDNIFGAGANQIALGSTINSATLTFNVTTGTATGSTVSLHTMLISWTETDTFTSLTGGVSLDDTEASLLADSSLATPDIAGAQSFTNLMATVQSWSDGGVNNGWVLVNSDASDIFLDLSEAGITPTLTIDYNNAPVITSANSAAVTENTMAVIDVTATDANGETPVYSINGGVDASFFTINATSGALTFITAPDFENRLDTGADNTYNVDVMADDGVGGTTIQSISVVVIDTNEAPVMVSGGAVSIPENTQAVTNIAATDQDGQTLAYSISGGADSLLFTINSSSGALSFITAPNFELPGDSGLDNVYDVQVTADDGAGGLTPLDLAITVTDANDAARFTSGNTFLLNENTPAAALVEGEDEDGEVPNFAISGGADALLFSIDALSGQLTFNTLPDFENPADAGNDNIYNVQVSVTDGSGFDYDNLTITVLNSNDTPVFTSSATATIAENTLDAATVNATDQDGQTPRYSITGGVDQTLFSIDAITGALTFNTAPDFESPLDTGGNNIYDVQITADDGVGGLSVQSLSITVANANDAPTFTTGNTVSIAENSTTVIDIATADQDGDIPAYSIVGGADAGFFTIDPVTGILGFITAPDFETIADADSDNTYIVQVRADDGMMGLSTQTIAVSVTDINDAPVITSPATANMGENTTLATTVSASDQDGDTPVFSLTGGADFGLFNIDANTGILSFNTAPDFESPADAGSDNIYDVQVSVSDGAGGLSTQNIAITVTDRNDAPVITSASNPGVNENSTAVTLVTSTDQDNDIPAYSITGGIDAGFFVIDNATGALSFASAPNFETALDNDSNNVYEVQVSANDGNGGIDVQSLSVVVIDINDAPVITSNTAPVVQENSTAAATITSTDEDADVVTYAITGGLDASLFSVDAATGNVTFLVAPDFEIAGDANGDNIYDLQITASDPNGGSQVQTLAIAVADMNEAPIVAGQQFSTASNAGQGSFTGIVTSQDVDANDSASYVISGGSGSSIFSIDSATGTIIMSNPDLLNAWSGSYSLTVQVTDSSGATSTALITINVNWTGSTQNVNPGDNGSQTNPGTTDPSEFNDGDQYAYDPDSFYNNSGGQPASPPAGTTYTPPPVNVAVIEQSHFTVPLVPEPLKIPLPEFIDRNISPATSNDPVYSYIRYTALNDALNTMYKEIDTAVTKEADDQQVLNISIQSSSVILTAGFATWALRGGSLLASFISTVPIWRGLDPMPILAAASDSPENVVNIASNSKVTRQDDAIDTIFDSTVHSLPEQSGDDADDDKERG